MHGFGGGTIIMTITGVVEKEVVDSGPIYYGLEVTVGGGRHESPLNYIDVFFDQEEITMWSTSGVTNHHLHHHRIVVGCFSHQMNHLKSSSLLLPIPFAADYG